MVYYYYYAACFCQAKKEKNDDLVAESFCADVRALQQRGRCTDSLCSDIILSLGKYLNIAPKSFRKYDKKMQEAAGVSFLRLNGCNVCNQFVYLPDDPRQRCPQIKQDGTVCDSPRCDEKGKAFEVNMLKPLKNIIYSSYFLKPFWIIIICLLLLVASSFFPAETTTT